MRGALVTFATLVVVVAGLTFVATGTDLLADEANREREWVESLGAWLAPRVAPSACWDDLDLAVGEPPTSRLEPVYVAAGEGCTDWTQVVLDVEESLIESHRAAAATTYEPELSRVAATVAGGPARTHCWDAGDWSALAEQFAALNSDEFWLVGLATPSRDAIDLSPLVCDRLRAYFEDGWLPSLSSSESLELSEALVVLAHEGEHLRRPGASEAEVECYALQRVRHLVRAQGHSPRYQRELAGLAWDLGYPMQSEDYRTERCFDGGPLDLRPRSNAWP